jgi:hypothetical protein
MDARSLSNVRVVRVDLVPLKSLSGKLSVELPLDTLAV